MPSLVDVPRRPALFGVLGNEERMDPAEEEAGVGMREEWKSGYVVVLELNVCKQ